MIKVKIGKREIEIESSMTVEQYQRIQLQKIFLENVRPSKLLSVYLDIPESELKNASKKDVEFVEAFIFQKLTDGVTKDMVFTFEKDGVTYGFENDWGKLAWGAWKDLEFLSSQDITENIHKILAVLYRPVTKVKGTKYVIEPYDADTIEERAESFKKIPVKIWFGSAQLFFFISKTYIEDIKNSLESQMRVYRMMERGTKIFPKWLRKKLQLDSILERQWNSVKKISQNLSI
jgi:hypothetical protein